MWRASAAPRPARCRFRHRARCIRGRPGSLVEQRDRTASLFSPSGCGQIRLSFVHGRQLETNALLSLFPKKHVVLLPTARKVFVSRVALLSSRPRWAAQRAGLEAGCWTSPHAALYFGAGRASSSLEGPTLRPVRRWASLPRTHSIFTEPAVVYLAHLKSRAKDRRCR
jgi:hypothetical protein